MSMIGGNSVAATLESSETIMHNVDSFLRSMGYDLPSLISGINFKSVGMIISIVIFGIFIFDLLSYFLSSAFVSGGYGQQQGDYLGSTYASYGRSLITTAADVWDQRKMIGIEPYLRNGRSITSLDSVVGVLDSIADAVHKWEKKEKKTATKKASKSSRVLF